MAGTAVFRMVVSSDSMKNATATSQGKMLLLEAAGDGVTEGVVGALSGGMAYASTVFAPSAFRSPQEWCAGLTRSIWKAIPLTTSANTKLVIRNGTRTGKGR